MRWLPGMLLLCTLAGCGDTFTDLVNEEASLTNEYADSLLRVYDEASAEKVQKYVIPKLKSKFKTLNERKKRFDKNTSINRILTLDQVFAGLGVGSTQSVKEGDFSVAATRVDKDNLKVEITCATATLVNDLRTVFNPETYKHFQSIKRRIDQQALRLGYLYTRLKAAAPDVEFPSLQSLPRTVRETIPDGFPMIPKQLFPFENFSNFVRVKPS